MKKHFLATSSIFLSLLILFMGFSANASSTSFGGRIINDKSLQIQQAEAKGFVCSVPGKTITIKPSKYSYPTEYLIPSTNQSRLTVFRKLKLILGRYNITTTPIECVHPEGAVITILLPTIANFNTS
jgi:hypothetical protein